MRPTACVHIIDDDDAVRDSVAVMLEIRGFRVACYGTAEAFLAEAPEGGCIVTDVQMAGLSGVELLQALRARGDSRPVILITARGGAGLVRTALASGAATVLEKPFAPEALIEELHRALGDL